MGDNDEVQRWAEEQVASAKLGDARRVRRAASMLRRAADQPAGRLTEVFRTRAELQAAYDFIETDIAPRALMTAFAEASLRAVGDASLIYAAVDGTSLSLTDVSKTKDFGSLGMRALPTRGLKVLDALAVAADGTPVGLLDLEFWARGPKSKKSRYVRRRDGETETAHWVDVVTRTGELVHQKAPSCVVPDRSRGRQRRDSARRREARAVHHSRQPGPSCGARGRPTAPAAPVHAQAPHRGQL